MSNELRKMIGEEKWEKLNQKYEHLDQLLCVCECETCGEVFFRAKVSEVQEMLKSGEWDIMNAASQPWYIKAARHWIPIKFHSVRVYVKAPDGDSTLIKDFSQDWMKQFAEQKKRIKAGYDFDKALSNELDHLEREIKKKT